MPRVADYSIITDHWIVEAKQDTVNFNVPANIDAGSRGVLSFMIETHNLDDMTLTLRLNGTKVWTWTFTDGKRVQHFQEVVPAGSVEPGANVFSFESSSGDVRFVQISDVVLWWQANI